MSQLQAGDKVRIKRIGMIRDSEIHLLTEVQTVESVNPMPLDENPDHQNVVIAGCPYIVGSDDVELVSRNVNPSGRAPTGWFFPQG